MAGNWLKNRLDKEGWQRVEAMWDIDEPAMEVENLLTISLSSSITAFFLAGLLGARGRAEHFIANNKFRMFPSKVQAQREMHSQALLGFISSGCRAGWRACAFAVSFTLLSGSFNAYYNNVHVLHYTAAGSLAGVLLKLRQGPNSLFYGLLAGAGISLPVGLAVQGFHAILPQEYYDAVEEEKQQRKEERDNAWRYRLTALTRMIDSMKTDSSINDLEINVDKENENQEPELINATVDDTQKSKK